LYGLEKAEKDTYDMSKEAMGIIKSIGHNEYLEELINMLIHRNK
jgi:geranylgeranyl diphosphate synthase type II